MKTDNTRLRAYLEKLAGMLVAERKYLSCLKKLSAAAFTDELRKGLSPESSDQQMHKQRLGLCIKQHELKKTGQMTKADQAILETATQAGKGKDRSLEKDLLLLKAGQQIFEKKSSDYQVIHEMAQASGLEKASMLLEQCFRDDQNALHYLLQVSQNIITPKVA